MRESEREIRGREGERRTLLLGGFEKNIYNDIDRRQTHVNGKLVFPLTHTHTHTHIHTRTYNHAHTQKL